MIEQWNSNANQNLLLHTSYVPICSPAGTADSSTTATSARRVSTSVAKADRYSGTIYAARFFVTRVGFLRSVKRILALSDNQLTVVDPYTDEVKENYFYHDIKEISVSADGGDRSFSIVVGKTKESYSCRNRQEFLSAYYQLRERASAMESMEAAGADKSNSGLYFDSLFQLCGRTFQVEKLSIRRSLKNSPVRIPVTLAIRAASIDRINPNSQETVSSIPLLDIIKIQKLRSDPNCMLIYYSNNNHIQKYWCEQREALIQSVGNNLRSWLYTSLQVEETEDSYELDAMLQTKDENLKCSFEMPVYKVAKHQDESNSNNQTTKSPLGESPSSVFVKQCTIALTKSSLIERDPETKRALVSYSISDIFNIVIYPEEPRAGDRRSEESGKFAIELKNGRTKRYFCTSCQLEERSDMVGLGFKQVDSSDHYSLLSSALEPTNTPPFDPFSVPENLRMAGSSVLYTPSRSRNILLCNLMELCRLNNVPVSWSINETPIACKIGTWNTPSHPEYEEILLKKLSSLTASKSSEEMTKALVEFNCNVPMNGSKQRDRRAFNSLMKIIETVHTEDLKLPHAIKTLLLLAIHRLVVSKTVFEEVSNSQFKKPISALLTTHFLSSKNHLVSFGSALVLRSMLIAPLELRNHKSEYSNRRAVFSCSLAATNDFVIRILGSKSATDSSNKREKDIDCDTSNVSDPQYAVKGPKPDLNAKSRDSPQSTRKYGTLETNKAVVESMKLDEDILAVSCVLQTLEACMSSGKKSTPEKIFFELLESMNVKDHGMRSRLFKYCRSPTFSIMKCSSILTKVHILEQKPEIVQVLQDDARHEGILIWQLYLALSCHEKTQRRVSSQLVALLTHENSKSSAVIRRIFPAALIGDLPPHSLTYDENGKMIHYGGGERTLGENSPRKRTNRFIGSRSRAIKQTKCVVLLPEFFERLNKNFRQKDLVWNKRCLAELCDRILLELANFDLERLRHDLFVTTDPYRQYLLQEKSEQNRRNKKKERPARKAKDQDSLVLSDDSENQPDEEESNYEMEEQELDYEDSIMMDLEFVRMNSASDADLTGANSVVWNDDEFEVTYHCIDEEVRVGCYYLGNLLNEYGNLVEEVDRAEDFMTLLYYRLLSENGRRNSARVYDEVSRKSTCSESADYSLGIQLLCLKVMVHVYEQQKHRIRPLLFMNHLLEMMEDKEWNLVVRGNIMLFVEKVLGNPGNVDRFLQRCDRNLNIVIDLMDEITASVHEETKEPRGGSDRLNIGGGGTFNADDDDYGSAEILEASSGSDSEFEQADRDRESDSEDSEYSEERDDDEEHELEEELKDGKYINLVEDDEEYYDEDGNTVSGESHHLDAKKCFVAVEKSSAMSACKIMTTCLGVLIRLVQCHMNSAMDPMRICTPNSKIKQILCRKQVIFKIVELLGYKHALIFRKSLYLIRLLVYQNDSIIPFLHQTGLFYYLLRFGKENDMESVACLLHDIHLRQHITENVPSTKQGTPASSMDSLTILCQKSILSGILPVSLIAQLVRHGPKAFSKAFFEELNTPEVIWNSSMRNLMVSCIEKFMNKHSQNPDGVFRNPDRSSNVDAIAEDMLKIPYPKQVDGIQVYQYYLENLLDEDRFPQWPISNEDSFLDALIGTLNDSIRPNSNSSTPNTTPANSPVKKPTKAFLSLRETYLVLQTIALLFRRFSHSKGFENFSVHSFSTLLLVLESNLNAVRRLEQASLVAGENFTLLVFSSVIEILASAVSISTTVTTNNETLIEPNRSPSPTSFYCYTNADVCATGQGVRVLISSLVLLEDLQRNESINDRDSELINASQHHSLRALAFVLREASGRAAAAAQSLDVVTPILPTLGLSNVTASQYSSRSGRYSPHCLLGIEVLEAICKSEGFAVVLLEQIVECGIHWYLILLILEYCKENSMDDSGVMKEIAARAADVLRSLMLIEVKEDQNIKKIVRSMCTTIESCLTVPIKEQLISMDSNSDSTSQFLEMFADEQMKPDLIWTFEMRQELRAISIRALNHIEKTNEQFELRGDFMYQAQKQELVISGIYLRFFNSQPSKSITALLPPDAIQRLLEGLLNSLAHDIAGVRQKPEILGGILIRMEPVLDAFRNILTYWKNIDQLEKEIRRLDAIPTVFSLLEDEFNSNILQLRSLECLQMIISSSSATRDAVSSLVPRYASRLFSFLNGFMNGEDSLKGKIATRSLQLLGNLCLLPACIDSLAKGMDASALAKLLPYMHDVRPQLFQLLLAMYVTPLRRHTPSTIAFAKGAVKSNLVHTLLGMLSKPMPSTQLEDGRKIKDHTARFLSILAANPGSDSSISSILNSTRIWDAYNDVCAGSPDDVRLLLESVA